MKIFDCVIYNGEDHLLDIRFNELDVDYFVIVESNLSFSGEQKGYRFDLNKFSKYKNKIRYIPIGDEKSDYKNKSYHPAFKAEKWQREFGVRNAILKGLHDCGPDDLVVISDVDELPNLSLIDDQHDLFVFSQICCQFKFNLQNPGLTPFFGSKAIKYKYLGLPCELRLHDQTHLGITSYDHLKTKKIRNGGFHFSFCLSSEKIIEKVSFYGHNERRETITAEHIEQCIQHKKDIWNGAFNYGKDTKELILLPIDFLPKYIQNNLEKFKDFLA